MAVDTAAMVVPVEEVARQVELYRLMVGAVAVYIPPATEDLAIQTALVGVLQEEMEV